MSAASAGAGGAADADGFPWDEAMAVAFALLRLPPKTFWRMTPREFALALRPFGASGGPAPTRAALDALLARFPDEIDEVNG